MAIGCNLLTTIAKLPNHLVLCASMDYGSNSERYKKLAKEAISTLDYNSPERCIISGDDYMFYYQITQGVIYITLTDRSYPKKLAFDYLQELANQFQDEYGRSINSMNRQYAALSFEQTMERLKQKYIDPNNGQHALKRLNTNLLDVQGIMQKILWMFYNVVILSMLLKVKHNYL
eukprot:UN01453